MVGIYSKTQNVKLNKIQAFNITYSMQPAFN